MIESRASYIGVVLIKDNMRKSHSGGLDHVHYNHTVRKAYFIRSTGTQVHAATKTYWTRINHTS